MKKYLTLDESMKSNSVPFCVQIAKLEDSFEVHSHSFTELVIILSGTAVHIIDHEEYDIMAGDIYVLSGDTAHGFKQVRDLVLCNIMYYPDKLFLSGGDIRRLPGFQALFVLEPQCRKDYGFNNKLQLSPTKQKYVREMIEIMQKEYDNMLEGCEAALQSYFMALVTYLSRAYVSDTHTVNKESELMNLANTVAYMESHYMEPITLKQLCSGLSISVRHFIRIFHKHYNATPIDYIIKLRLEHALELLRDDRINITQVAYRCGFTDSNYFTRQFRSRYGLSPRSYRALMPG